VRFLFGVAFGALGMWAYQSGRLSSLTSNAPDSMQQVFNRTSDAIQQRGIQDQVRQVASAVQDKVQQANTPGIAVPSAAEVAGRPSEPLPRQEPEGVHLENS
jgi:hypothetical protein